MGTLSVCAIVDSCKSSDGGQPKEVTMSKTVLQDKIKGGWAGQTIGCTFGGPTEFRYSGMTINDSIKIEWPDGRIKWYYDNEPGLYDDVYMDLTFVNVFEKEGLDVPISSFEKAFSTAEYPLWHANQQARYNIQQGIKSPDSGFWKNNPHADDIDFQIEADYAGLMAPGMPNSAIGFTDGIGHMMNYGDGWYGGVYVATMYSLAFVSDDIEYIVTEALKAIPQESRYYRCMSDIIKWHKKYPEAWELTWALCQKYYSFDIGCPDGVYKPFNIDAVVNSAYILIGLLYGDKDFGKTIEIAARCGYDSDCNPASAGGILGTILGYDNIPEYWKKNLREVEDRDFAYTTISLNDVYKMSYNQALKVIERDGGAIDGDDVVIKVQEPKTVRLEQSFANLRPIARIEVNSDIRDIEPIKFSGKGIVVGYSFSKDRWAEPDESDYVAEVEVNADGQPVEKVVLPTKVNQRKQELFYKYDLADGEHTLTFKWLNPEKDRNIYITYYIPYK